MEDKNYNFLLPHPNAAWPPIFPLGTVLSHIISTAISMY